MGTNDLLQEPGFDTGQALVPRTFMAPHNVHRDQKVNKTPVIRVSFPYQGLQGYILQQLKFLLNKRQV